MEDEGNGLGQEMGKDGSRTLEGGWTRGDGGRSDGAER